MRRLLIASTLLFGCSGDKDLAIPDECNPLGGSACVTPWPSSVYEKDDSTSETGRRVDIPKGALPTNTTDNIEVDPATYNKHDGFSSAAPMFTAFETGVDPSNLPSYKNFAASLDAASPTVLIDMSTGELVPHFAELDAREPDKIASQALYIRSATMLKGSTRYVAAIKKTLKAKGGGELPISEGFAALVSGEKTTHPLLEKVRPRYKAIFDALKAHGIDKTDLVVAWDFTTRSRASVKADLSNARSAALAAMGTNAANLTYSIINEETPGDTRIAKKINGLYDGPMFMQNTSTRTGPAEVVGSVGATPGMSMVRDGEGKPMVVGMAKWPFTVIIPACAVDPQRTTPVPVILYGHGLLGAARDQVSSGGMRAATSEICAVGIGTDMFGMSDQDVPNVLLALNDGNNGHLIFDALVQGMMNHVALVQIAKGPMLNTVFAKTGGGSLIDPTKIYYYGISQGGIMGTTVCAIDPVIKRCVVQVGAINYSLLLERSRDWPQYRIVLSGAYNDPLITTLMINLMQNEWDRTEPTGVADTITTTGFPDTPAKQVFMQVAIADDEVANLGSEYQARTMGVPLIMPSPVMPYGLTPTTAPASSGILYYDYGLGGTIPETNEAPPDNDVHSQIRNKKATTDMMKRFYETGEIINLCTGPTGCVCKTGGQDTGYCGTGV